MRYDVTAPVKGYNGTVGGVTFYRGRGHVDEAENPAAVAYFRRRGYTLAEVHDEQPEQAVSEPKRPGANDPKVMWERYIAMTTDLSEAEAHDLKKAELIELAEAEKEQS